MNEYTTQTTRGILTTPGKGHTTILTSFRHNGMGVGSPVGTVASRGKLYFMTAADSWKVKREGGPEELKLEEKPRPQPQAGEVLLRVHAAGVNPIDWKIRQGLMKESRPVTFPYTPGIEMAGVVEDVGPAVTAFEIGQAVFGQIAEGAYAEYLTVPVEALALKPQTLSFVEAATVPVGATTAWRTLFDR